MAGWQLLGILVTSDGNLSNPSNQLTDSRIYGFASTQATYFGGTYTSTTDVPGWSNNDVMGIKYEKGILRLYKNGTLATATATGISQTNDIYAYIANDNASTPTGYVRFDKDSWTQSANAGVDYTWQLSEGRSIGVNPTLIRPQRHFETLLYTGTTTGSGTQTISDLEFAPDFVWIKSRAIGYSHLVVDTVRGASKGLLTEDENTEETTNQYGMITSFGNNGFTMTRGSNDGGKCCENTQTYVAWCWKAGGAAVANTDGTLNSQVSVNEEAGFSIVSWTSTGTTGSTIGHGLGKKPAWIVLKGRNTSENQPWRVYHHTLGAGKSLMLNSNNAVATQTGVWNDTLPTSSVFTVGSFGSVNENTKNYIAYCWYEVPGFSKFGNYTGNGSSDGPNVHLGFKPAWVLVKGDDFAGNWNLLIIRGQD